MVSTTTTIELSLKETSLKALKLLTSELTHWSRCALCSESTPQALVHRLARLA